MPAPHQAPRGIVLAAGASRRMGQPKALLQWLGEPLVAHAVRPLLAAGVAEVVVVVGAWPQVADAVPAPARAVVAKDWALGMRASLRAGVQAVGSGPLLVTHADRPGVRAQTIQALLAAPGGGSAAPSYQGRLGHPVRVAAALRARLLELDDVPLRAILGPLTAVPVSDPAVCRNLNRPEDWARFLAGVGRR